MGGRAIMIVFMGMSLMSGINLRNISQASVEISSNVDEYYLRQISQNLAHGGVRLGLRQLANNRAWRSGFTDMTMLGGKVSVQVVDTVFDGTPAIAVRGIGMAAYGSSSEIKTVSTAFVRAGEYPDAIYGLVTSRGPVKITGNLLVEGRNHTLSQTLVPRSGVYGIWSTSTVVQLGGSDVGGTATGTDYHPSRPGNPAVVKAAQEWPAGIPATPDGVLGGEQKGFPEGTLKAIAQSGKGGSQYVTDPSKLTFPLKGVTYVELPNGGTWRNARLDGTGILVVHNNKTEAVLKNIQSGKFAGIIIVDDILHVHNEITGALVSLTTNPSGGGILGNAQGSLTYSREAIMMALGMAASSTANGSESEILAWKE